MDSMHQLNVENINAFRIVEGPGVSALQSIAQEWFVYSSLHASRAVTMVDGLPRATCCSRACILEPNELWGACSHGQSLLGAVCSSLACRMTVEEHPLEKKQCNCMDMVCRN